MLSPFLHDPCCPPASLSTTTPPQVPDVELPGFFDIMDNMVLHNSAMVTIDRSDAPDFVKSLQKLPHLERVVAGCLQTFFWPTKKVGSLDMEPEMEKNWVY